jgi:hypothetical protein
VIYSKTYGFEKQIWNKEEEENLNARVFDENSFSSYESTRRTIMFALCDPFDQRIIDFITPNQELLQKQ